MRFQAIHSLSESPTYHSWESMKARCYLPSKRSYRWYGAKGIKVCGRWHTFKNFLADMGIRPEGKTLDRLDGSKDYGPENCRWATPKEQAQTRSYSRKAYCKRGHPMSGSNLYIRPDNGERQCRACKKINKTIFTKANGLVKDVA